MPISVPCECGQSIEAPEEGAGGLVRCPHCGRELTVPKPKPPFDEEFIPWGPVPTVTSGKAIASLALGLLFIFACLSGVPAILLGSRALSDIRLSGGRLRGRRMAIAGIVLGVIGCLFTPSLFLPSVRSAREAARRSQCTSNLKQIAVALHFYHDAHGSLPPAAITDKNGRPLLSWRVAILPYMNSGALYAKFHLDEPWNSPHNFALLEAMPNTYACPSDRDRKPGTTGYQAVIGPSTAFTPDFIPVPFHGVTDGLAHTLVVGETRRCVPWTKAEDLPFDRTVPLSGLGSHHGYHNNGFNVLFADGRARFLKRSIAPGVLAALLTRNGKEVISPESY